MSKPKFKVGDKVKILDGRHIPNYYGGFIGSMEQEVGNVYSISQIISGSKDRVAYRLNGVYFSWDERGLELAQSCHDWKVVIIPDGDTTVAKFYENDKIVKEVTTKKSPDDEYDWKEAVKVLCDRLCTNAEHEPEKFYNGRVFCVDSGDRIGMYTTGKIYEFKDGQLICDYGTPFPWIPIKNVSAFIAGSSAKWMEVVE